MKSIRINFLYNLLLNVSKVLFPLITAPYISRTLLPSDIGLYNFAFTYAGYFALVALLGIPTYGIREVSKRRDDKKELNTFLHEMFSIAFFNTIIVSLLYVISIFVIGKLTQDYLIFLLIGITLYMKPFALDWFFSGIEEFGFITFRSLFIKVLSVIALFVFVRTRSDLIIYVLISIFANIGSDLWNFIVLYKKGFCFRLTTKGLLKHIKPLLLLFSSSVAISVYVVLDTIMLGFMNDYSEVAYYTYASHISKTLLYAATSLSVVAMPRVSYYIKNHQFSEVNNLMTKSLSLVSFLAFPMCVGLILVAPIFIPLFYGDQYYGAIIPLQITSVLLVSLGLNNLTGVQCLIGAGKDKQFLCSVLVGAIANFVMNCCLIPSFGAIGASLSSVAAETLILFLTAYFVVKTTPIKIHFSKEIFLTVLITLVFIPIYYVLSLFLKGWWLLGFFVIMGGGAYIALQYLCKNQFVGLISNNLIIKVGQLYEKFHS